MHFTHPLRVSLCKVIVYGDDMHALARKRVQIRGKGGNERFTFTRFHFGDTSLMQTYAADYLNVEVLHTQNTPARLSQSRECVEQNIVERFALCKSVL